MKTARKRPLPSMADIAEQADALRNRYPHLVDYAEKHDVLEESLEPDLEKEVIRRQLLWEAIWLVPTCLLLALAMIVPGAFLLESLEPWHHFLVPLAFFLSLFLCFRLFFLWRFYRRFGEGPFFRVCAEPDGLVAYWHGEKKLRLRFRHRPHYLYGSFRQSWLRSFLRFLFPFHVDRFHPPEAPCVLIYERSPIIIGKSSFMVGWKEEMRPVWREYLDYLGAVPSAPLFPRREALLTVGFLATIIFFLLFPLLLLLLASRALGAYYFFSTEIPIQLLLVPFLVSKCVFCIYMTLLLAADDLLFGPGLMTRSSHRARLLYAGIWSITLPALLIIIITLTKPAKFEHSLLMLMVWGVTLLVLFLFTWGALEWLVRLGRRRQEEYLRSLTPSGGENLKQETGNPWESP
jgi:hypothetical protein